MIPASNAATPLLLVDAGNTRIKWRVVEGRVLLVEGVVASGNWADLVAAWHPFRGVRAVLSCVAGDSVRAGLAQILEDVGATSNWLVAEAKNYGLLNHYRRPEQLGADRYAALIAAARLQLGDCVVASIGTACTIDLLDRSGAFLGGVILPGPDLMRAALLDGTGQIEVRMQTEFGQASRFSMPPRDTAAAVAGGIAMAQAGAINAMCEYMQASNSTSPQLILTGGAREQALTVLQRECIEIDDLVLEGLAWIGLESTCAR